MKQCLSFSFLMLCCISAFSFNLNCISDPPEISHPDSLVICGEFFQDSMFYCDSHIELIIEATDDITAPEDLIFNYEIDLFMDGTIDIIMENAGNDASATYPYGTHLISWIVIDTEGNSAQANYTFTINDCKNPTPVCDFGNTYYIPITENICDYYLEVQAIDILENVYDNCSDSSYLYSTLRIRREGDTIPPQPSLFLNGAANLGTVILEVWVEDEAGNEDMCSTYIIMQYSLSHFECCHNDSIELVNFYNNMGGEDWTVKWDLEQPYSTWFGVEVTADGCVICLDLDGVPDCAISSENALGNNLKGDLYPLYLPRLTNIQLSNNEITGKLLGTFFYGYPNGLRTLNLSHNNMSGDIPYFLYLVTQELSHLKLSHNNFENGIPVELGYLPDLELLDLSNNNLRSCIPLELTGFCDLGPLMENSNFVGYDFSNNARLPWQGEFENYCNDENQIGAPCDDGNENTVHDIIESDCWCRGFVPNSNKNIEDLLLNFEINPNPNNGLFSLNLNFKNKEKGTIRIQNILGRVVLEKEINTTSIQEEIDLQYLPNGTYFINWNGTNYSISKKFIKN